MLARVHHEHRRVDVDTVPSSSCALRRRASSSSSRLSQLSTAHRRGRRGRSNSVEFVGLVEGLGSAQLPVDQLVDLVEFVDPLDQGVQFRCGRREFGLGDRNRSQWGRTDDERHSGDVPGGTAGYSVGRSCVAAAAVKASSSAGSYLSSRGPTRRLVNRPSAT